MRILSEKQYKELVEESEDISCKDTQLILQKWENMGLLPMNCIKNSLCIFFAGLVKMEREKEINLKQFIDDCLETANKIVDNENE